MNELRCQRCGDKLDGIAAISLFFEGATEIPINTLRTEFCSGCVDTFYDWADEDFVQRVEERGVLLR